LVDVKKGSLRGNPYFSWWAVRGLNPRPMD